MEENADINQVILTPCPACWALQKLPQVGANNEYFLKAQCWTEGRSSTAVAEDFRPTATDTVAEVLGHSYGRRWN